MSVQRNSCPPSHVRPTNVSSYPDLIPGNIFSWGSTVAACDPVLKTPGLMAQLLSDSASYGFRTGEWDFNEDVASNWKGEMEGHIPSYWRVISLSFELVSQLHRPSARILVYWAATGNQFPPYLAGGWEPESLVGWNYSAALNARILERFPDCPNRLHDAAQRPYDPSLDGRFDVVQMHWSLHFEPVGKREALLQDVFNALNANGTLLLTEKTTQPQVVENMYDDFKRSKGISDDEIAAKKVAIKNVLVTLPSEWYELTLKKIGFEDVCIVNGHLGFVTWIARKKSN